MSRVYRALEKAEEEKNQKRKEDPPVRSFEEKAAIKNEMATLRFREEKIKKLEELGLPPREDVAMLIVPPHSFAGEEFRRVKAEIFQRLPNPPQSILVTSAVPG